MTRSVEEPPDPEWEARFPDEGPRYCSPCLFRDAADVEARALYGIEPDRSA